MVASRNSLTNLSSFFLSNGFPLGRRLANEEEEEEEEGVNLLKLCVNGFPVCEDEGSLLLLLLVKGLRKFPTYYY